MPRYCHRIRLECRRLDLEKLWAPIPWMLEAAIVLEWCLANMSKPGSSRCSLCSTPRLAFFRRPCPSNAGRLEEAAGADRLGSPRWRLEKPPGRRLGAGRHREALARWRRCRGRAVDRGERPARSIHAHRRVDRHRSRSGVPNLCRGAGAPRRGGRAGSRRREPAPSSDARPSWFARPMSSVHSKRPCCAWCAISRCSTAF
jgi:hypothetical protein